MRASIKNYMDALRRRREEHGESGFSLIELIVVVVILGVLAAIAVPIFFSIQGNAEDNALRAAAGNGATAASVAFADGPTTPPTPAAAAESAGSNGITVSLNAGSTDVSNVCVTATNGTKTTVEGPGCLPGARGVITP